ncbi:TonB-dependent receptor [Parahaliea sp. F7430]|uniref:TonB-dependent receptor n=1 Tax=Sediminihaliea albiluteola TaxID=2758564 RepID=A0A7W2YJ86_9GAMM|nr:TonB-dependent receptor [Sediminihaliea albiluteola]MBA6413301.1 TonB-dependent receptor [Sediminihaliea albiluteola]
MTHPKHLAVIPAFALLPLALAFQSTAVAAPQLEEVVVTAEKRAQSIQEVPLSVVALAGSDIEVGKIEGLNDIAFRTPGVSFSQFNVGEPRIYIRGIGNSSDSAASDPAVGMFLDEVYIGRTGGVGFDLFDLERIEILRGPQGTLYGKNTNGGAINMVTSRPSEEKELRLRGSIGSNSLLHLQGLASGPLSDSAAGKLVFSWRERDGFDKNVITPGEVATAGDLSNSRIIKRTIGAANGGDSIGDIENWSLRGQLLFDIGDDAELLLGADHSSDKSNGACRHLANLDKAIAGLAPFWEGAMSKRYRADERNCASQFDLSQKREVSGLMARLEYDMGWSSLTSITAWRASEYKAIDDLTGLPLIDLDAPSPPGVPLPPGSFTGPENVIDAAEEDASQWSQEIRLAGSNERFNWLAGVFYMEEKVEREEEFYTQYSSLLQGLGLAAIGDVLFTQDNKTKSIATYGQVDWIINDQFTLTYGLRWAEDKKDITQNAIDLLGTTPAGVPLILPSFPAPVSADDSWSKVTQKLSLAYQPTNDLMLYATYSEGYKSGAFQSQTNLPSVAAQPVDPEFVTNIEVGLKSSWWNNRMQFNLSYYDMDYEDLQVFELNSRYLLVLLNAQAKSKGVEASFDIVPTQNLTLSASYSWNDASYDKFINANGLDLSGNDLAFAPEQAYTLSGNYNWPLSNGSELDFSLTYSWKDDYFMGPQNRKRETQESLGLLDAGLSWVSPDSSFTVDLWGKNLTDELLLSNQIVDPTGVTSEYYMPPRTYGVTLTKSF